MGMDEGQFSRGQVGKVNGIGKSVGDAKRKAVFGTRGSKQAKGLGARRANPVAWKIERAVAGLESDRTIKPGRYGYSVCRAGGTGVSWFVARREENP